MLRLSRTLHCLALLSFLLPFFYTGCGVEEEKKAEREKFLQDSLQKADSGIEVSLGAHGDSSPEREISLQYTDTLPEEISVRYSDSMPESQTEIKQDNSTKLDSGISQKLVTKYSWLRPVLIPSDQTYTGLAMLIDGTRYIRMYSVVIGFILLLLALLFKFIQKHAVYAIVLTEVFGIAAVLSSLPLSLFAEREWGYWVFAGISGAMLLVDIIAGFFRRAPEKRHIGESPIS